MERVTGIELALSAWEATALGRAPCSDQRVYQVFGVVLWDGLPPCWPWFSVLTGTRRARGSGGLPREGGCPEGPDPSRDRWQTFGARLRLRTNHLAPSGSTACRGLRASSILCRGAFLPAQFLDQRLQS